MSPLLDVVALNGYIASQLVRCMLVYVCVCSVSCMYVSFMMYWFMDQLQC